MRLRIPGTRAAVAALAALAVLVAGAATGSAKQPAAGATPTAERWKPASTTGSTGATHASGAASTATPADSTRPQVDVLTVEGAIQPITAEVIRQAIDRAEREHRDALVIRLDTPGGLDSSMRDIIKRMLISEVPVIVYVAPSGGRAASAGTFITYAACLAAMSPGTSIGAATPVQVGGGDISKDMARKVKNDAVSYIQSLAEQHGRNAEWAEKAVREGGSLNENQALKIHVIDLIARDTGELLDDVDGRQVKVAGTTRTLRTKNAERHDASATWRQKFLGRIIDPNVAYILFILGFYGILFELGNPGSVLPGVVGGICLLLAFLAFQALPVNMAGVFLIIFAMVLFAADIKVQSHGILTLGGVVSLILGSLILLGGDTGMARISISVIGTVVVATVAFFGFVFGAAYRAQRRKPVTGAPGLLGERGTAVTPLGPKGQVFVHGEYWAAEADEPLEQGAAVVVDRVEGLVLRVKKA